MNKKTPWRRGTTAMNKKISCASTSWYNRTTNLWLFLISYLKHRRIHIICPHTSRTRSSWPFSQLQPWPNSKIALTFSMRPTHRGITARSLHGLHPRSWPYNIYNYAPLYLFHFDTAQSRALRVPFTFLVSFSLAEKALYSSKIISKDFIYSIGGFPLFGIYINANLKRKVKMFPHMVTRSEQISCTSSSENCIFISSHV